MGDERQQIGVRLARAEVDRLDAVAVALEARTPGLDATRSTAIRTCLLRGLAELETELGIARKAGA